MAVVKAHLTWTGPESDVLGLWVDDPTIVDWMATATDDDLVAVLREVDEHEEETGRIAGVEIVGLLEFDRWDNLPDLGLRWQLPGRKPLPLDELLKRMQKELRRQAKATA